MVQFCNMHTDQWSRLGMTPHNVSNMVNKSVPPPAMASLSGAFANTVFISKMNLKSTGTLICYFQRGK